MLCVINLLIEFLVKCQMMSLTAFCFFFQNAAQQFATRWTTWSHSDGQLCSIKFWMCYILKSSYILVLAGICQEQILCECQSQLLLCLWTLTYLTLHFKLLSSLKSTYAPTQLSFLNGAASLEKHKVSMMGIFYLFFFYIYLYTERLKPSIKQRTPLSQLQHLR